VDSGRSPGAVATQSDRHAERLPRALDLFVEDVEHGLRAPPVAFLCHARRASQIARRNAPVGGAGQPAEGGATAAM